LKKSLSTREVARQLQVKQEDRSCVLRRFRRSDLDGVLRVERVSFGPDAYPAELFLAYAARTPGLFLVVVDGAGEVAGYSIACRKARSTELVSIAVAPRHRRNGVANRLLVSTIGRLRRAGERRLTLAVKVTNRGARRFYEKHGFVRVRLLPGYYEDGRDGLFMALDLG
jgi:ribosomal-protein-alanine N-acetyltransferase